MKQIWSNKRLTSARCRWTLNRKSLEVSCNLWTSLSTSSSSGHLRSRCLWCWLSLRHHVQQPRKHSNKKRRSARKARDKQRNRTKSRTRKQRNRRKTRKSRSRIKMTWASWMQSSSKMKRRTRKRRWQRSNRSARFTRREMLKLRSSLLQAAIHLQLMLTWATSTFTHMSTRINPRTLMGTGTRNSSSTGLSRKCLGSQIIGSVRTWLNYLILL